MSFPTPSGNATANMQLTGTVFWVVSYYNIVGRAKGPIQFVTVSASNQNAAIAKAKLQIGSHASDVGSIVKGPFNSLAEAQAGQNNVSQQATSGTINPSGGPAGQPTNFSDILGRFNLGSWFLRIGEILLGIVLVGVGIARITGAQNVISNFAKTKMPIPIPI